MTIKVVFFDAGQTLLSPVPDAQGFVSVAARQGIELTAETILANTPQMYQLYEQHYQRDNSFWDNHNNARAVWIEVYTLLYRLCGAKDKAEQLADAAYDFYFNPGAWYLYDDVMDVISDLHRRGLRLGLISNWDSSLTAVIQSLEINDYLSDIIASADVGVHKPDQAIFDLALNRLSVQAHEAMHVGDHLSADFDGALSAGLHAVLIDRGARHREGPRSPRIESLTELPALLDSFS